MSARLLRADDLNRLYKTDVSLLTSVHDDHETQHFYLLTIRDGKVEGLTINNIHALSSFDLVRRDHVESMAIPDHERGFEVSPDFVDAALMVQAMSGEDAVFQFINREWKRLKGDAK